MEATAVTHSGMCHSSARREAILVRTVNLSKSSRSTSRPSTASREAYAVIRAGHSRRRAAGLASTAPTSASWAALPVRPWDGERSSWRSALSMA